MVAEGVGNGNFKAANRAESPPPGLWGLASVVFAAILSVLGA